MKTFMRKISRRPADPTATVFINGRALLCFSRKNDRAEVGFLNIRKHPLLFTIYNSNCEPVFGTPVDIPRGTIDINTEARGIGTVYQPGISEAEDFRYLLSFDRIHTALRDERLLIKPESEFLAELYLKNGTFFNAALSSRDGIVYYVDSGKEVEILPPQRIGKVIGAFIEDDEITINITGIEPITLKRSEGRYNIVIRYKCILEEPHTQTDFDKFYEVLGSPSSNHKIADLQYVDSEIPYQHPCERNLPYLCEHNEKFKRMAEENAALKKLLDIIPLAEEACQAATIPECPHNLEGIPEDCPES